MTKESHAEPDIQILHSRIAALEQLIEVYENSVVEQADKLFQEIAERKRAEEEIRRLNTELGQKVEERSRQLFEAQEELVRKEKLSILGQLSGSVGHELRNPLGIISNAIYFLKMVLSDANESVREYLGIIENEICNSERIIADLLDFARTKPPQRQDVSAKDIVRQSLERCAIPDNVTLAVDIQEYLPMLNIDPLQIGQVLMNVITNAVQAMPQGGSLRIGARLVGATLVPALEQWGQPQELPLQETANFIEISVEDTGEGITPENMKKLFQPLFTTKPRGIGLGLVVCRNLVEANGGRIEVESEAGKGSVFKVVLPVEGSEKREARGRREYEPQ